MTPPPPSYQEQVRWASSQPCAHLAEPTLPQAAGTSLSSPRNFGVRCRESCILHSRQAGRLLWNPGLALGLAHLCTTCTTDPGCQLSPASRVQVSGWDRGQGLGG